MNREQKGAVIEEIAAQIAESEAVFAVDYRGITVAQAAELRVKLRESDASLRVVKNTLTERAADKAGAEGLKPMLQGPTALTFARGDVASAAKAVADYARTTGLLPFKGGVMNGDALAPEQVVAIARLPSRDVLNAQLVNVVASPLIGLVTSLSNLISGLARQLSQVAEKMQSGEIPSGPAPAPAAAESAPEPDSAPAAEAQAEVADDPQPAAPAETEAAADAEPAAETQTDAPAVEPTAEAEAEPATDTTSDTDEEKE